MLRHLCVNNEGPYIITVAVINSILPPDVCTSVYLCLTYHFIDLIGFILTSV